MENLPAAVGFAAVSAALSEPGRLDAEAGHQRALTTQLAGALDAVGGVTRFGDPDHHLPHLVCAGVEGVEPQAVLLGLNRAGIAAHSGSACASESLEPSPVLAAMGVAADRSLRLSVGWNSTVGDVEAVAGALGPTIAELRQLAGTGDEGHAGSR
jgi:cysteine desulfurase